MLSSDSALEAYALATFATRARVRAVLRPGSLRQTAQAIAVAAEHGVPVYTISRGRNWGYGCRVPARDGCVVLELSRLRKIGALDDELGTVTVQAGVSFAELSAFLRARRARHALCVTGGSPEGSVVGNALERGIGVGVGGQRVETLCGLEVLLATGERIRTGFGRYPEARAGAVQRWGLGPSLDGLFSQSNLGVVTAATVWLQKQPRWAAPIQCSVAPRALPGFVGALRELVATGTLRGVVKLNNWYAGVMLSGADPSFCERPRRSQAWFSALLVASDDRAELAAKLNHVRARLGALASTTLFAGEIGRTSVLARAAPRAPAALLRPLYFGRPEPSGAEPDPARDGCGVIFLCPVVPLTGADVRRATTLVERCWLAAGYAPYITLNLMDERAAHLVCGLFYDRRKPGEDRRALAAYGRAFRSCLDHGYYPYRLGIQSMDQLPAAEDGAVLARIKRALDPRRVLSPGRYEGGE